LTIGIKSAFMELCKGLEKVCDDLEGAAKDALPKPTVMEEP